MTDPCPPVHHTPATLRAWTRWRHAHPNWTPTPSADCTRIPGVLPAVPTAGVVPSAIPAFVAVAPVVAGAGRRAAYVALALAAGAGSAGLAWVAIGNVPTRPDTAAFNIPAPDATLTPIPEPGTFALLGMWAAALIFGRRARG